MDSLIQISLMVAGQNRTIREITWKQNKEILHYKTRNSVIVLLFRTISVYKLVYYPLNQYYPRLMFSLPKLCKNDTLHDYVLVCTRVALNLIFSATHFITYEMKCTRVMRSFTTLKFSCNSTSQNVIRLPPNLC